MTDSAEVFARGKWYVSEAVKIGRIPPGDMTEAELSEIRRSHRGPSNLVVAGPFETQAEAMAMLAKHPDAQKLQVWRCR